MVRAGTRRADAGNARDCRDARRGAPLRREPASMGGLLSHGRAALRRRHGDAGRRARSSPTTISTTPTRPTSSWPSSIPGLQPPSPSSSTPIRAAWRSPRRCARPMRRRSPAIRSAPSAASSRSTARSMPRPRERSSRSSPRSSSRLTRAKRHARSSRRRRICGCCSRAAFPIRRRKGSRSARSRAASWSSRAIAASSRTAN